MEKWDAVETPVDGPVDPRGSSRGRFAAGTPEDVAALYTWANLQGARYRDFSASRKRYREQVRAQAAEPSEVRDEGPTESKVVLTSVKESSAVSLEDRHKGGSAVRWASNERKWESSSRSLNREDFVPRSVPVEVPGEPVAAVVAEDFEPRSFGSAGREQHTKDRSSGDSGRGAASSIERPRESSWESVGVEGDPLYEGAAELWSDERWERVDTRMEQSSETGVRRVSGSVQIWEPEVDTEPEIDRPAWLCEAQRETHYPSPAPAPGPTVQLPREEIVEAHITSRWSALRDVMDGGRVPQWETRAQVAAVKRAPLLVVFSLTGGVGRTSLLSTLGRGLSASGERVVLGDAAPFSLLPFYFGARDLRPGEMRAFAPPEGSEDSPIFLVNYDLMRPGSDAAEQRHMVSEILRDGAECHRILLDLPPTAGWLLRRLATLQPTVLVPLLPDMTSVISLEAVERYFSDMVDAEGVPVQPFYVLNQFDESMALHRDIHELLRKRLRERLLNIVIRRSGAVSEALAEGMTVADYAPDNPVTRDYFDLAEWLRTVSPAATPAGRGARSGRG